MTYRDLISLLTSSGVDIDDDATVEVEGEFYKIKGISVATPSTDVLDAGHIYFYVGQ